MRTVFAGVLAGLVLFFWGFVSHMLLPLGSVGMKPPGDEDIVLAALKEGLPEKGIYYLPYVEPAAMQDEARMKAHGEKALASPYAFVVYDPQGRDPSDMGANLGLQWACDTLIGLGLAGLLGCLASGFGARLGASVLIGLLAWLSAEVQFWNWYRFPLDFTLAAGLDAVVGFLLAGATAAVCLGRGKA